MFQVAIVVIIFVGWILLKAFEVMSDSVNAIDRKKQIKKSLTDERMSKYGNRIVNKKLNLIERNQDIILNFIEKVRISGAPYVDENLTRDCINEICLAENDFDSRPEKKYLVDWRRTVGDDYKALSDNIIKLIRDKRAYLTKEKEITDNENKIKKQLQQSLSEKLKNAEDKLSNLYIIFHSDILLEKDKIEHSSLYSIEQCFEFLTQESTLITKLLNEEREIVNKLKKLNKVESGLENELEIEINNIIDEYNETVDNVQSGTIMSARELLYQNYKNTEIQDVQKWFDYAIYKLDFPIGMPKYWESEYIPDEKILMINFQLPDLVYTGSYKIVKLKSDTVRKELNKKEKTEILPKVHPAIILKVAFEVFRNDCENKIDLLVINGFVIYNSPETGQVKETVTNSLAVKKDQILELNLTKLNPLESFKNLQGRISKATTTIDPIIPILTFDKDKRIIESKDVIDNLEYDENLASMDWQDFENLIVELFRKKFQGKNIEVNLTQSSRDKGVDAIIYNPDPVTGGKYVVQAKRYTNTVDVSAVRDLVATTSHEGANRGILVTTSSFGADAYNFIKNKPITLIDGRELLGMLTESGYKFKIDLAEARRINNQNQKNI